MYDLAQNPDGVLNTFPINKAVLKTTFEIRESESVRSSLFT